MTKMTGGEAIVRSLIGLGVDTIFGLPGVQNDALFNALHDNREQLRIIHTRHEQGAAYMAMGYALSSEKPGIYAVVPGPGLLNTTAALSTAYATNAKVLCLAGQIATDMIGKNVGVLHEIPDQLGVIRSLTKWAEQVPSQTAVPDLMTEAFTQLYSGRPRPVGVEMPMDVLAETGEVDLTGLELEIRKPSLNLDQIEAAAKLLGGAKRPLIFVGSGAIHAREEIQALAEMLQAPVIPGRNGRGILSNRHYLGMAPPDGYRLWEKADVVIGIGARMYRPLSRWGLDDEIKVIRVDIDPTTHNVVAPPAIGLVADSQDATAALLNAIPKHNRSRPQKQS